MPTDNFNRADSYSLGANWTESDWSTENSIQILNNQVVLGAANGIAYHNDNFPADQYAQASIKSVVTPVGDGKVGLAVRMSGLGTVNSFAAYVVWLFPASNQVKLMYYNGGLVQDDYVELASAFVNIWLNEALNVSLVKISAVGTTIKVLIDGVEKISVTNSSIAAGSAGLVARSSYWQAWDDWEAGAGDGSTFTITASSGAHGSISPTGAVAVASGASQTFNFTPDANYHVADVLVDSVSVGAPSSYEFTNVVAAHTISVTFAIDTYTITASAGANGSIAPSGAVAVNAGGSQAFTISPALGYDISAVLVDSVSVGTVSSYNFTNVLATHTISATFQEAPSLLMLPQIQPTNCGFVTINGNTPQYWFPWGQYVVIEPVPDAVYTLRLFVSDYPDSELTLTTQYPSSLPEEFQSCIIAFACYALSMKLKKWKQAAKFYNIYIRNLKKRKKDYIDRKAEKRAIHHIPDNVKYSGGGTWAH